MYKRQHAHSDFAKCMLIIAAALLVGCKDREAELRVGATAAMIERYKPQGLAQLERIRRVRDLVRDRAPLDADARSLPFEKASFRTYTIPPPDGAFVDAEWLTEEGLRRGGGYGIPVDDSPFWGDCVDYLTTGKDSIGNAPWNAVAVEQDLRAFLKVRYLGVARTVELRQPSAGDYQGEFIGGRYRFDMFFYELADPPKYLGGLRVDARNETNLQYEYREGSRQDDMGKALRSNLEHQTRAALYKLMTERAKGITMDPPPVKKSEE